MTEGNPYKQIVLFAIPILIGSLVQQFYLLMDMKIIGNVIGDIGIAAVGSVSTLYMLINTVTAGLNKGFSLSISNYYGAKDYNNLKRSVATMLMLNVIFSIALTALTVLLLKPSMYLIKIPETIFNDAYSYMIVIVSGLSFNLACSFTINVLYALGNSKFPLLVQIICSIINIFLNLLFVSVLGFGVRGAAITTVISNLLTAILCGICIAIKFKELLPDKDQFKNNAIIRKEMLSLGVTMALANCTFSIGSVFLQGSINTLSENIIAAHTSARKIIEILILSLGALCSAVTTFMSQNWGAGNKSRAINVTKTVIKYEMIVTVIVCILCYPLLDFLIVWVTNTENAEILYNAKMGLTINFIFIPFLGPLAIIRSAFRVLGNTTIPLWSTVIELIAKVLFAYTLVPYFGYIAAAITEPLCWLIVATYLAVTMKVKFKDILLEAKKQV